jgi:hypothetical protein
MSIPGARVFAGLLVLFGTPGCGAVKRVHDCQGVIEVVNTGLTDLHVEVPDAGASASAYARIADGYDALSKRLAELSPRDPALAKAVESYLEISERAAKNSRSYSEALATRVRNKKDRADQSARLARIRTQAQAEISREAQVVRKLNSVCHPQ